MSATGIRKRHTRSCRGKRCTCSGSWEASVWSSRDEMKIRKTFERESEAKAWRADALTALRKGSLRPQSRTTLEQTWEAWFKGARDSTIRNRGGHEFKPSALRRYEVSMRREVLPRLGSVRLSELRRHDLQDLADELLAGGLSPSSINVTLLPVRATFRRAISRGEIAVNPCSDLDLPAVSGRRERFATPEEAKVLIGTAPDRDRAIWATAFYSGLRVGELQALRVEDVDLAGGVIRVGRGWDAREGVIELKSQAGRRKVPVAAALRDYLTEQVARSGRTGSELIFGNSATSPFTPGRFQQRADREWAKKEGLDRITPHECRHSYASIMIAAGVNAKAISTFMGHANISITLDRYGHLMPGSEEEAAALLDSYLDAQHERAEDAARSAGGMLAGAQTGAQAAYED